MPLTKGLDRPPPTTLPKEREALAEVLLRHVHNEASRLSVWRTMKLLAWEYLANNCRHFKFINPNTGDIRATMFGENGKLDFVSQELSLLINQTVSRLSGMNFLPKVTRDSLSLAAIRERAAAQALSSAMLPSSVVDQTKKDFVYNLVTLGSCGLSSTLTRAAGAGLMGKLEVVHPLQMLPWPSVGYDLTVVRGDIRHRYISISELAHRLNMTEGDIMKKPDDLSYIELDRGESPGAPMADGYETMFTASNPLRSGRRRDDTEIFIHTIECWEHGPHGTASRYCVTSGKRVFEDVDFSGFEVYPAVTLQRFYDNGTYHGMGMFDALYGLSRQAELMLGNLFDNVRDTDRFPVLVLPQGEFNARSLLKDVGRGLRVLFYEPDPNAMTETKPFHIQPVNAGDVPGRTAQFAREMLRSLAPTRDLLREKGRADSFPALQFLQEEAVSGLTQPVASIDAAYGNAYRRTVSSAIAHLLHNDETIPVQRLSLDLAGVIINTEDSTVSFRENPLPTISRMRFGISETSPRSEATRKSEAVQLNRDVPFLYNGDSPYDARVRFIRLALSEGLDFAYHMEDERNAHETVVRHLLILYGDGEYSADYVLPSRYSASPAIQIATTKGFMGSPAFLAASSRVQDAISSYFDLLLQWSGMVVGANPDDLAMLAQFSTPMQRGPALASGGGADTVQRSLPPST